MTRPRILLCCSLFVVGAAAGCDERLSQNARTEDLKAAYDAQVDEQGVQLTITRERWDAVKDAKRGNPREIDEAAAALSKIHVEKQQKQDAINTSVAAAEQDYNEANEATETFVGKVHVGKGRVWCGGDGCGAVCSDSCSLEQLCFNNICRCIPKCANKECGADGCGGVCGDNRGGCPDDHWCSDTYQCVLHSYQAQSCKPSCRLGGLPARAERRVREKTRGAKTLPRNKRKANPLTFQEQGGLASYVEALNMRAEQLTREQQGHVARAAKILDVEFALNNIGDALKLAQATYEAAKSAERADASPDGGPALEAAVADARQAVLVLKDRQKALKATLRTLKKEHRADDRRMKKYAASEVRMRAELRRITPIADAWKNSFAAADAAQVKLDAAKAVTKGPLTALDAEYAEAIANAVEELRSLTSPAFSDEVKAIWGCDGPMCPTSARLIRGTGGAFDLNTVTGAVEDLYESRTNGWRQHQEDMEEQSKQLSEASGEESDEDNTRAILKPYPDWGDEVENLGVAQIHLEELEGANNRKLALRKALHTARMSMAQ